MTNKQLQERIAELEAGIDEADSNYVDPEVLTKAKSVLQFAVNDVKIALAVLDIQPTDEQRIQIEDALIASKVSQMSERKERTTTSKW